MAKESTRRPKSLEAHIRKLYDLLPESERQFADCILDFPGEIAAYSETELSQFCGGSKAAMTRLVHRLGFENFEEARRAARDARDWGSPMYLMKNDSRPNSFRERLTSHLEQDAEAVHLAFVDLHEDQYTAIAERICAVKRIWFLGYRNSHFLTGYFRWQLIQVRGVVHILPGGGESLAEHLSDITPNDLLIVVGFRRRIFEVRRVLGWAERKKVTSLLIADPTVSGDTKATWTIRCETRGADVFDRYAGIMSLFHFLSTGVVAKAGGKGRKRLAKIEELHEDFHQFN